MSQSKRKRLSPEARKKAFVDAALGLFFENGVENTTMQQIAKSAGVSYGLFYHYFSSKEDILNEIAEQISIMPRVQEYLSADHGVPLDEKIRGVSKLYLSLLEENKEVVWILLSESRKRPRLRGTLKRIGQQTGVALAKYLQARQKLGEVKEDIDLEIAAKVIWGQLFSCHIWRDETDAPPERYICMILEGIAR